MNGSVPPEDWEEGQVLTVGCMVGRGPEAVTLRAGIAKTGLRTEDLRFADGQVRDRGARLAMVDMGQPDSVAVISQLMQRTPKCWTMAVAADAALEADALCAGAEVVLRSPLDAEVVALWVERLRERVFQMDTMRHALERETAKARAEAIGEFASSLAQGVHEPLCLAAINARGLREALSSDDQPGVGAQELAELAGDLEGAVERLHRLVVEMRCFLHTEAGALEAVELSELVHEAVASAANPRKVPVEIEVVTAERAMAHRVPLERVLDRILEHALDALASASRPRVHIKIHRHAGEPRISIRDNGPPIGPQCAQRLFQPFFRPASDSARKVGLAPCREYVARMGGALEVSCLEQGAVFQVRLQAS